MVNQKRFGVWMDTHHAKIVGSEDGKDGKLVVLAHITGEGATQNSSEKNENNHRQTAQAKFFKEITTHLQNATHLHATGTGQVQEQFIHYLSDTAQFKNVKTEESTANKMSDENLVKYFSDKLN